MRRCIAVLAATALTSLGAQTTPVSDFSVAGLRVIYKPVTANDVVAVRLILKGGAAALTARDQGIENLIVQAMTHGTGKYTKDAFSALATSTGTDVSGTVNRDYTTFLVQGVRQNWDQAWDLFTEAVMNPTFPDVEVQQVRDQIVNGLKQRADDPDGRLRLIADSVMYAGHPYDKDVEGAEASVAAMTRDDLLRWRARRLTKENLVFVVVGNVPRRDLESKITAAFGALPATGGAAAPLPPLRAAKPDVTIAEQQLPTNYVEGLFVAAGRASPDYAPLQLALRVLSERLFEEVRTKRNLTYAVFSGLDPGRQSVGQLYVTAVNPDTTVKVMKTEVRKLQRDPIPLNRLKETLSVYTTAYWMSQQTNMGQAQQLGEWEVNGGGWRNAIAFPQRMKSVTPAEAQRVANRYLKNIRFVVVGDPKKVSRAVLVGF